MARSRPAKFGRRFSPRSAGAFVLLAALLASLLFVLAHPLPAVRDAAVDDPELRPLSALHPLDKRVHDVRH